MRRILICLSFVFFHLSFSFAQQSINIVFIGNSITYGALHQQRELMAPPAQCARWLSQQEGIDTDAYGYFKNHYKTDVFEEKDVRGRSYWLHPNEQGATRLAEFWGKAVLNLE